MAFGLFISPALANSVVRVGVTDGPQAEIIEQVRSLAAKQGIELVVTHYVKSGKINQDLVAGKLDVASFQDGVALKSDIKARHYPLIAVGTTVTLPMGLYSKKVKNLRQLKPKATVTIPSADVVRALRLMHTYDMIRLPDTFTTKGTVRDIAANPVGLRIIEVPPEKMIKSLDTADVAILNYQEATKAGLYPARDGLGVEDSGTPYTGVLTIRTSDRDKPWVVKLISVYRSEEIKRFILTQYQNSVRRSW